MGESVLAGLRSPSRESSTPGSARHAASLCATRERADSPGPAAPSPYSPVCPPQTQPYVLSPCVSVTTESMGLEHGSRSAWAVIEVAARLSRIPSSRCPSDGSARKTVTGDFIEHQLGRCAPQTDRRPPPAGAPAKQGQRQIGTLSLGVCTT